MILQWIKNKSNFNTFFLLLLIWVNFWLLSTFAPWKGWRGTWKTFFSVKNDISMKNLGGEPFWAPKTMPFLNSGCNVSIQAYYLSLLAHHRVFRNVLDASFRFMRNLLGKMLLLTWHGLASIFIDIFISIFSCDCNPSSYAIMQLRS